MRYGMVIDLATCAGCAACVMACKQYTATPQGIYWCNMDIWEEGKYPNARKRVLPHACMLCQNAPCAKACPTGATHYGDEGFTVVNQERCIGCKACVKVCPYDARHYYGLENTDPYFGSEFSPTPYEEARTLREHELGKVGKCMLCLDRLHEGKEPLCVKTCITRSRTFGDLDDPNSEVSQLIAQRGATVLHPEEGTQPCVYYIGLEQE